MADFLTSSIENSKGEELIKQETLKILAQAEEVKAKFNDNEDIKKEYSDVRYATIGALVNLKAETQSDLDEIKAQLGQGGSIDAFKYSEGDIDYGELGQVKREYDELVSKNNELEGIEKIELDAASKAANVAKSGLLMLMYGADVVNNGFDSEGNLLGYNNIDGNFVVSLEEFEKTLKNEDPSEWNQLALINYFKMISEQGKFGMKELIEIMGAQNIIALSNLWNTQNGDDNSGRAKQFFLENKDLSKIVDGIENLNYSQILLERDGLEVLSLLFDGVNIEQKNKIKTEISAYFSDYIYEGKDISELENIAGQENLSGINDGMYRFIIEQARRTIVAQESINVMKITYFQIPGVTEIYKAMLIMTLQGNGMDSTGKISFSFEGINDMISKYNEDNSLKLELFGTAQSNYLESLFSSNSLLNRFTENIEKLKHAKNRIESLRVEINNLSSKLRQLEGTSSVGNDRKRDLLTIQLERKKEQLRLWLYEQSNTSKELEISRNEYYNIGSSIDFENKILFKRNIDFSNNENIEDYLNNRIKISTIDNKENLLKLLAYDGNNINISEIHKSLRGDIEILGKLSGFNWSNINLISSDTFVIEDANSTELLNMLLMNVKYSEKSIINKFITANLDNLGNLKEAIFQILISEDGKYEDFQINNIKNVIKNSQLYVEFNEVELDTIGIKREAEKLEVEEREEFENIISKMRQPGYDNSRERGENIDDVSILLGYLNKYGIEEVKTGFAYLVKNESYFPTYFLQQIIPNIPFNESENYYFNLVLSGINKRGTSFSKSLNDSYRSSPLVIEETIKICSENDLNEIIQFLNIEGVDDIFAVYRGFGNNEKKTANLIWADMTEEKIEKIGKNIPTSYSKEKIDILLSIFDKIKIKYNSIIPIEGTIETLKDIVNEDGEKINLIESFLSNPLNFPGTVEQKEVLLLEINKRGFIDGSISTLITEVFGNDEEKISLFTQGLLESVEEQEQQEREERTQIGIEQEQFPSTLLKYFELNKETNEFHLSNIEGLVGEFKRFCDKNNLKYSDNRNYSKFLEENKVTNIELIKLITITLEKDKQGAKREAQITDPDGLAERIVKGPDTVDEFNQNLDNDYDSGKISYSYPNIKTQSDGNKANPQHKSNNISSQNLQATYDSIKSELNLTPEEAKSLTEEEIRIIGSSEKEKQGFIHFKKTLDENNMQSCFPFRHQIFKAIGSLNFNISDGDYIGENELNIFLSKVTYATLGKDKVPELKTTPSNIVETMRVIRRENKIGFFGQVDKSSVGEGGGVIETLFREKFAPKDAGFVGFKTAAFLEALKA
ncbi:hypothetical protein GW846_04330 [Candidatus Gracilibacteria bacterium]|nr:hypothetical protein [Candidatus Gracilibacteria bacterium]